jgi:hypothetical protein
MTLVVQGQIRVPMMDCEIDPAQLVSTSAPKPLPASSTPGHFETTSLTALHKY